MAIAQLNKITLFGSESCKDSVIDGLQELGCVHLINLTTAEEIQVSGSISKETRNALHYLKSCPERLRQVQRAERLDREKVVAEANLIRQTRRDLKDEADQLRKAIHDLKPWGEFKLPDSRSIENARFWFYEVPLTNVAQVAAAADCHRVIARDHANAYILVLNATDPEIACGTLVDLDPRPLSALRNRLDEVEEHLEELHHQRVGLTRWCYLLEGDLDAADDAAAKTWASKLTLDGAEVYALQGWVPRNSTDKIRVFAKEHGLALTVETAVESR